MIKKAALLVCTMTTLALPITVDQILDKMEANENQQSSRVEVTETVYDAGGSKRVSKMVSYGYNKGEKGLMEYVAPARIKGMKILMLNEGDDIWFYSARTGRVRKIASGQRKQSANNSDFSYEDMSTKDRREDYDAKLLGEEKVDGAPAYTIDMKAKSPDQTYSRMVFWVDKSRMVPLKAEFYDETGELWKKLTMDDIVKVEEYWTAKTVEMKNVRKGTRTVMAMDKVEYDIGLDEAMFSERNLKR
jgi:outer membrane lipoprotein-sorting protein